jgi:hypothetical protein
VGQTREEDRLKFVSLIFVQYKVCKAFTRYRLQGCQICLVRTTYQNS